MNAREIARTLNNCAHDYCSNCKYAKYKTRCQSRLLTDAQKTINSQASELDTLKKQLNVPHKTYLKAKQTAAYAEKSAAKSYDYEKIRSDAIKDFAEKLKTQLRPDPKCIENTTAIHIINHLVNDMTTSQKKDDNHAQNRNTKKAK